MAYKDPEKKRAAAARQRAKHKDRIAAYNRQYWAANAERLGEYNRRKALAWVHADPERLAARKRQLTEWGERNPERVRAATAARRTANRVAFAAKRHLSYVAHKDQEFAASRARRARVRGASGTFTAAEWRAMRVHYGNRCVACGSDGKLTVDHVIPLSLGGGHSVDNIQPLCLPCNLSKHRQAIDYRPCHPLGGTCSTAPAPHYGRSISRLLKS